MIDVVGISDRAPDPRASRYGGARRLSAHRGNAVGFFLGRTGRTDSHGLWWGPFHLGRNRLLPSGGRNATPAVAGAPRCPNIAIRSAIARKDTSLFRANDLCARRGMRSQVAYGGWDACRSERGPW